MILGRRCSPRRAVMRRLLRPMAWCAIQIDAGVGLNQHVGLNQQPTERATRRPTSGRFIYRFFPSMMLRIEVASSAILAKV